MWRIELQIDVSGAPQAPPGPLSLAATAFIPTTLPAGHGVRAIFAIPGGGYSRGYFDMRFPGFAGYSQAEYHTARGDVLIALDPLGVGTSSLPDSATINFTNLASTYDAAIRVLRNRLANGELAPGVPPLKPSLAVGIGQSMGGCVTILAQGRYQTFDAIAPLGFSAIHTRLPQRTQAAEARAMAAHALASEDARGVDVIVASSKEIEDFVYPFHWEDVPKPILDADMAGGYPLRRVAPPFGSKTIPGCAVSMMAAGIVSKDAAAIGVPVFVGVGERDVCPDPHAEPSAYRGSHDVTLCVVPRMAHMHNFAGTRAHLWQRLDAWMNGLTERSSQ